MKTIVHIVGARPNFMKLSPVYEALTQYSGINQIVIHTGQHYSPNMSDIFFKQLGIPAPLLNLEINGGSPLKQIGNGIIKLEPELLRIRPDLCCIYGDINATAFTAIVTSKLGVKLAHIEAGLRSNDLNMPEETNRIIADALTDYFFTPSLDASENLIAEGKKNENIYFVGNVMIDTLIKFLPAIENTPLQFDIPQKYILVTLHRPSNVDDSNQLKSILEIIQEIAKKYTIVFPMHPRTKSMLSKLEGIDSSNFLITDPLDYFRFIKLQKGALLIITDSGGVQEESTYLGVPCFTLRDNTERPITVTQGTNLLIGTDVAMLRSKFGDFEKGVLKKGILPELWDGKSGERIAKILSRLI
jgi:UDP-N-acetylglucosamine 2-epimerase (non-hydrolysing)